MVATPQPRKERRRRQKAYDTVAQSPEFQELRKRYRGFAFPATAAFMAWYLLYVVCANWAPGLMGTKVLGNINVALVFGILQFVSTFLIAWLYSRHARKSLDPLADKLGEEFQTVLDTGQPSGTIGKGGQA